MVTVGGNEWRKSLNNTTENVADLKEFISMNRGDLLDEQISLNFLERDAEKDRDKLKVSVSISCIGTS